MEIGRKVVGLMLLLFSFGEVSAQRVASFPLSEVRLLEGEGNFSKWRANQSLDSAWIFSFPVSRLLHTFRTTAGAYSSFEGGYSGKNKVEKLGGWESMDCDLRGHAVGHLLSAYALMRVSLPSEKGRLEAKEKGDSLVRGLRECQELMGTGYLSAFPDGLLKRNLRGSSVWAPWYTIHKLLAGLLLQYRLCGNATALEICKDFSQWTTRFLSDEHLSHFLTPDGNPKKERIPCYDTEALRQRALRNEFGGIGEAFYDLYALHPDDDKYFDYYERALYNHILGQQAPETGMVHYFLATLTGAYKLYSTYDRSFWCCVGSSFESHASIYLIW